MTWEERKRRESTRAQGSLRGVTTFVTVIELKRPESHKGKRNRAELRGERKTNTENGNEGERGRERDRLLPKIPGTERFGIGMMANYLLFTYAAKLYVTLSIILRMSLSFIVWTFASGQHLCVQKTLGFVAFGIFLTLVFVSFSG